MQKTIVTHTILVFLLFCAGWQLPVYGQPTPQLVITPSDNITVQENVPVTLDLDVINGGVQPFTFSVTPPVQNTFLDPVSGTFLFLPDFYQSGTYNFVFSASDGLRTVTEDATVIVEENNRLPILLVSFPEIMTVNEGASIQFTLSAVDEDIDNNLTYNVEPPIANMVVNATTGQVLFSPDYTQAGVYPIEVGVSDGFDTVSELRFLVVENVNRPPTIVLNPSTGRTVLSGETFNLLVSASDLDQDKLTITASGLPANGTFNATSGFFSFRPQLNQFRDVYNLQFQASDSMDTVSSSIQVDVSAVMNRVFDFNPPENEEGWTANGFVNQFRAENGFLSGISTGEDPIIQRAGFGIDTFSQREMIIRMRMQTPSPIQLFFVNENNQFFGPALLQVSKANEFVNYVFAFSDLFPSPQRINIVRIDPGIVQNSFDIDFIGFTQSVFPTRTPTPNPFITPSPTPTNTPSVTATPTPTATNTSTPTPDPAHSPTPTATPLPTNTPNLPIVTPIAFFNFNEHQTLERNFDITVPAGFQPGQASIEGVIESSRISGNALSITVNPGQGMIVYTKQIFDAKFQPVLGRMAIRPNSSETSIALIAFNSPFGAAPDGQLGYSAIRKSAILSAEDQEVSLYYFPPGGFVQFAVQIVQPHDALGRGNVIIDNLSLEPIGPSTFTPLTLEPDGKFEGNLTSMTSNINFADGSVQTLRQSDNNHLVRLAIQKNQTNANVVIEPPDIEDILLDLEEQDALPGLFVAEISVFRELGAGGTLAFVITDGDQTLAVFQDGNRFLKENSPRRMFVGGSMVPTNADASPFVAFQVAGPGIFSSLLIDNLVFNQMTPNYRVVR